MGTENTRGQPKFLYFLVAICILVSSTVLVLMMWRLNDLKESIVNNKIVASIVTSREDEKFVKKLREELGLKGEVAIIIAPRYDHSLFSPLQTYELGRLLSQHPIRSDPNDPTGKILMQESIYKELSDVERRAAIAHQMCHIYSFVKNGNIAKPGIGEEIEANQCTIKYESPDILIGLYQRYGGDYPSTQILIDELKRQGQ